MSPLSCPSVLGAEEVVDVIPYQADAFAIIDGGLLIRVGNEFSLAWRSDAPGNVKQGWTSSPINFGASGVHWQRIMSPRNEYNYRHLRIELDADHHDFLSRTLTLFTQERTVIILDDPTNSGIFFAAADGSASLSPAIIGLAAELGPSLADVRYVEIASIAPNKRIFAGEIQSRLRDKRSLIGLGLEGAVFKIGKGPGYELAKWVRGTVKSSCHLAANQIPAWLRAVESDVSLPNVPDDDLISRVVAPPKSWWVDPSKELFSDPELWVFQSQVPCPP